MGESMNKIKILFFLMILARNATLHADFIAMQTWINQANGHRIIEFFDIHYTVDLSGAIYHEQQADFIWAVENYNGLAIIEDSLTFDYKEAIKAGKKKFLNPADYRPEEITEFTQVISPLFGLEYQCEQANTPCINVEFRKIKHEHFGLSPTKVQAAKELDQAFIHTINENIDKYPVVFALAVSNHIIALNQYLQENGYNSEPLIITPALHKALQKDSKFKKEFHDVLYTEEEPSRQLVKKIVAHPINLRAILEGDKTAYAPYGIAKVAQPKKKKIQKKMLPLRKAKKGKLPSAKVAKKATKIARKPTPIQRKPIRKKTIKQTAAKKVIAKRKSTTARRPTKKIKSPTKKRFIKKKTVKSKKA